MKKLRILFLCVGLILSSSAFAADKQQREIKILPAAPAVQNEIPNVFRPVGDFFRRLFGKKRRPIICPVPNVENLTLSQAEITAACPANSNSCAENLQSIEVTTDASNPNADVLTYVYKVSGGEIVGTGAKVQWNLSGVKPGTYTITAGVDDGCGVCGRTVTKEVKVIECPNCN